MDIELTASEAEVALAEQLGLAPTLWSDREGEHPGVSLTLDRATWEGLGNPRSGVFTVSDPYPEIDEGTN